MVLPTYFHCVGFVSIQYPRNNVCSRNNFYSRSYLFLGLNRHHISVIAWFTFPRITVWSRFFLIPISPLNVKYFCRIIFNPLSKQTRWGITIDAHFFLNFYGATWSDINSTGFQGKHMDYSNGCLIGSGLWSFGVLYQPASRTESCDDKTLGGMLHTLWKKPPELEPISGTNKISIYCNILQYNMIKIFFFCNILMSQISVCNILGFQICEFNTLNSHRKITTMG